MPHRQTLALTAASTLVALPALVRQAGTTGGIVAALAWTVASAWVLWAGVGAHLRVAQARTAWLQLAWVGAFLQLDISLRYRRGWAIAVGLLLLAAARGARAVRLGDVALAGLLALVPLVTGRASPAFVALGPAALLLARGPRRAWRVLSAAVVVLGTVLYTSAWPRDWGGALTEAGRSKAWAAAAVAVAAGAAVVARWRRGRDLSRWRPVLASGALYLGLSALWAHPLLFRLDSALPQDPGDPVLNTWILWWNTQALPFTTAWWNAPILHPVAGTLTFSEHLFGLALLTTPLQWLGLSPVAAYNVAFVLSQPLAAAGAHALAYRLTRRHDAALLAGLAFGFAPYRLGHLSHIQVLWCAGLPVCLLGLHAYLETRRRRWLVLFAAAWLWQGLANGYLLFYVAVVVGLWLAWFVRPRDARVLVPIGIASLAVLVLMAPVLYAYASTHARLGLERNVEEMSENGCALTSFLDRSPSALLALPGEMPRSGGETSAYPGLAAVLLVAAAWVHGRVRPPEGGRAGWPAGSTFGVGLAAGALAGRWTVAVTVGTAFLGATVAVLASRTARAAVRERTPFGFYTAATIVLCLLAIGPDVRSRVGSVPLGPGPFALLATLPGFHSLRSPGRFAMVAAAALAAAVGLAAARLFPAGTVRTRVWIGVAALVIACDGWTAGLPVATLPRRAAVLEELGSEATVVVELPFGGWTEEFEAMYRAMYHRLPIVNGWTGHVVPHYRALERGLLAHDPVMLDVIAETGAVAVLLHHDRDRDRAWERILEARPGTRCFRRSGPWSVYLLARRPAPARLPLRALPIASVVANDHVEAAVAMRDGDLLSRWTSSRPQSGHEVVEVHLAAESEVEAVVLALGRYRNDSPRFLSIATSRDGVEWRQVWAGRGEASVVRAALASPLELPVTYEVPRHRARHVRLSQLGSDPAMLWSIAELDVLGPPQPSLVSAGWQVGHQ